MIGSVLDKYEVLQKLGEGATATVYRGRHLTTGRDVAIKVLHPHLSASSRYRERFNREARAVGRLAHPNIVSILDYSGQNAEECYIVTELVDGVTLQELIQMRGRLPSEIAALAGADLASALAFAHRAGIIHRDIKPDNVMIRRDGRVKLMDFGVARVLDESSITLDGSLLGSPAYMSPQQALDETLDGRSDLFSLGTVLFHSVTGHVPFSGSNASVILRNIIEANRPEVLELAPQASPAITAVIDRLLQPRPEDRYPDADQASESLLASLREVHLAPDHPTINLRSYIVDAAACEEHLAALLRPTLLQLGKERLAAGDTLGALQQFNRLLAIDEENSEVLALIQSLHQAAPGPSRRARFLVPALALLLVGAVLGGAWWVSAHGDVRPGRAHPADARDPSVALAATAPAATPDIAPDPALAVSETTAEEAGIPAAPNRALPPEVVAATLVRPAQDARSPARLAALASSKVEPARVVLRLTEATFADVWVDGERLGPRKGSGAPSSWVGTEANPLLLAPGKHKIEVRNPFADPFVREVQVSEGEPVSLDVPLVKKQATFVVNSNLPRECSYTVGGTRYESVAIHPEFKLREPPADTPVVFTCPAPFGSLSTQLGRSEPGGIKILPTTVDVPRKHP